jgi:hypothetical protein
MDSLQIGVPTSFGFDIGVADLVPHPGSLSAYLTFLSHGTPPTKINSRVCTLLEFLFLYHNFPKGARFLLGYAAILLDRSSCPSIIGVAE